MKKIFVNIIKAAVSAAAVTAAAVLTSLCAYAESGFLAGCDSVVFNTENGLDSASVNSIAQTPDGYIWLGTYTGLYRYDGSRFTHMGEDEGIESVRSVFTDSKGGMWVGTNDNGAVYYGADGSVLFFSKENGLDSNSVRCFCEAPDGTVYIGTSGKLCAVSPDGKAGIAADDEDISYVPSLAVSETGIVAGVTNSGIFFAIDGENIHKTLITPGNGLSFSCVCYEKDEDFLAGSSSSYVYRCTVGKSGISFSSAAYTGGISGICSIKPDGQGGWWFCGDAGLAHSDENFSSEIIRCENFSGRVDDVITDYQGNYWFVSARQGVMKLSRNPFIDINAEYGFPPEAANAAEIYGGFIYFGYDNGLKIINAATREPVENELTERLNGTRVRHIYADSKGYIWISTYGTEGLFCYKPEENGEITIYSERSGGTLGSQFRFVTELSDGIILAVSSTGLSYIQDGSVICTLGTEHGLDMPQILCAVELEDGSVLAGSDGDGIYIIKGGRIYRHIGEEDGLTSLVVMRIVKYKDVYFIVTGNSLFIMDKEGKVSKLNSFRYANNFDIIADEESGKTLILSGTGIFEVNGDDLAADRCESCILYNRRNGLNTSITANSWSRADEKGGLYLCCGTGIRYVSLSDLSVPEPDYKLSVNSVSLSDGTVILPENDSEYDGKFVIPAEANRVSFQPVVLNYTLNDPELYIYLEGFEEKGINVNQSGLDEVSFTNIPYGSYYFHLQIIDAKSGEPVHEAVYLVEKEAQFFEQPVFRIYLAIVAMGAAIFITWLITKIGSIGVIKRQYEEIRTARDEAESANNAKSRFLANVSHEIRTPINTILGMDEMILRECSDPQIERYASDIKHSGTMLLAIVSDILDVSKIESGQMKLIPADYDISVVISDLAGMAEMKCREKGLEFRCEVSPDTPRFLYGDDLRIKQVISNLLSNAVKYTEKGYVALKVRCEDETGENVLLCVSVEDSGIGIKEEEKDKLCAEFERLDEKRNRNIEGTGLGLSISRNLLEMMGSSLEFISEYGSGSVFGFSVKQKKISGETVGKISVLPDGKKKSAHLFSAPDAEILVVDDNKMNIEVVKSLLKGTQIKIDSAEGGEECLEAAEKKRYSMILLDHMMPEMDGIETLEKIRCGEGPCRDVPVIILTANAVAGSRQMYLDKGFDDYLTKPVSGTELERMILRYLPEELIKPPCEAPVQNKTPDNGAKQLKHINIKKGLLYADGSAELLERIMNIYLEQSGKTAKMAENCFAAGDMKNYEIVIHSLKSTSLGIGAEELSEAAKKLENAARNGDTEYVKAHHEEAMALYRLVISEAAAYLGKDR